MSLASSSVDTEVQRRYWGRLTRISAELAGAVNYMGSLIGEYDRRLKVEDSYNVIQVYVQPGCWILKLTMFIRL